MSSAERTLVSTLILEPGTGKAIELLKGQILRVEQVEGGQCVDFNCFNLHDYKESMHTGRTRTLHGLHPTEGHFMWSAPPRERAMMYLLEDTVRCNDVMFPRCSANLYESVYGLAVHTNCHDIQAEAQREYGLTPDDVHDSFNLFMQTGVRPDGSLFIERHHSVPGDHVDLLALMDVLAVPNRSQPEISARYTSPLKVFEALAAGLPLVASDLPSLREVLSDGEDAVLAAPDDEAALAQAIRRLAGDAALRGALAARGRARAAEHSWDARARRLLAWMESAA